MTQLCIVVQLPGLVHSQIPSRVPLILITVKYTYMMKITASSANPAELFSYQEKNNHPCYNLLHKYVALLISTMLLALELLLMNFTDCLGDISLKVGF